MINKTKFKPPEPVDGVDFYVGEIHEYTVCVELCVLEDSKNRTLKQMCVTKQSINSETV